MNKQITILLSAITILFFSLSACAVAEAEGGIDWNKDYKAALAQAKNENKILMIDVYTDWCHWCKELDKKVFTAEPVVALSNSIITVKLNAEDNGIGTEVAQKFGVQGYPTILFITAEEQEVDRIGGFLPAEQFAAEMERIIAGKDTKLTRVKDYEEGTLSAAGHVAYALEYLQQDNVEKGEEILLKSLERHQMDSENAQAYAYLVLIFALKNEDDMANQYLATLKSNFASETELIERAESTLTQIRSQRQ